MDLSAKGSLGVSIDGKPSSNFEDACLGSVLDMPIVENSCIGRPPKYFFFEKLISYSGMLPIDFVGDSEAIADPLYCGK